MSLLLGSARTNRTDSVIDYGTFNKESKSTAQSSNTTSRSISPRDDLEPQRRQCKVILLGDTAVGKTSLMMRFVKDEFPIEHTATIGVEYMSRTIFHDSNLLVTMNLWDLAGQDRFAYMVRQFSRGTHCAILVYDVTKTQTLENVRKWKLELDKCLPHCRCILIGNKYDLIEPQTRDQIESVYMLQDERFCERKARANSRTAIEYSRVEEDYTHKGHFVDGCVLDTLIKELDIEAWYVCSAATGLDVDRAFRAVAEQCIASMDEHTKNEHHFLQYYKQHPSGIVDLREETKKWSYCSC